MSNPYAPPPRGRRVGDVAPGGRPGQGEPTQPGAETGPYGDTQPYGDGQQHGDTQPHGDGRSNGSPVRAPGNPQHPAGPAPWPQNGPQGPHGPTDPRGPHGPHGARGPHAPSRPGRGPQTPPDPEDVRRASRRVMDFGLLMLATLVTAAMPLPWQAAGLAFAVVTVVVGIRALQAAWRAGLRTLVPLLGVGLAFAMLMSVALGAMLALWPLQVERRDCLRDALTISARETCEADYQKALQDRLEQATRPSGS